MGAVLDDIDGLSDGELLDVLDARAPALLYAGGAPLRPLAGRLAALPSRPRPWAHLVVARALHDADAADRRAPALAEEALAAFRTAGDPQGEGFALCTLASWALARGDLERGADLMARGEALLGDEPRVRGVTLVNRSLGAYARGNLRLAQRLASEGAAESARAGMLRAEATAHLFLGFFSLWTGEFARVQDAVRRAEAAFSAIPADGDRSEWPLLGAVAGPLAALRGDRDGAARAFADGLAAADLVDAPWLRAIVLVARAEYSAPHELQRSLADARWAVAQLRERGDSWWSVQAAVAEGVALGAAGDHDAAVTAIQRAAEGAFVPPVEAARYDLLLGEQLAAGGHPDRAIPLLFDAEDRLTRLGARFWAARAAVALAGIETSASVRHWERARELAGRDAADDRLFRGGEEVRVRILGRPGVFVGHHEVRFPTRHARLAVLALATAGADGLAAETLQTWLWPEADRDTGARRLKTALWQARRALGPASGRLHRRGQRLLLDLGPGECDLTEAVAVAEDLLTAPAPAAHEVRRARLRLGQRVLGGEDHDEWVLELQDRVDALDARLATA